MGKLADAAANSDGRAWWTVPGLWLAGLLATPFHAAADGAALHVVADGRLYHVAAHTAATSLVARLDVGVESMTTLNGSLYAASSGNLPALYEVAAPLLEQKVLDALPLCVHEYENATDEPFPDNVDRARVVALEDVAEVWFITGPLGRLHRLEVEPEIPRVTAFCTVLIHPKISVVKVSEPRPRPVFSKKLFEKSTALAEYADEKINRNFHASNKGTDGKSAMELLFLRNESGFTFDKKAPWSKAEEIYQSNVDAWVKKGQREMKSKAKLRGGEALQFCKSEYERLAGQSLPYDAVKAYLHIEDRSDAMIVVFANNRGDCAYTIKDTGALVRCHILVKQAMTIQHLSDWRQVFLEKETTGTNALNDWRLCIEHRRQGSDFMPGSESWSVMLWD